MKQGRVGINIRDNPKYNIEAFVNGGLVWKISRIMIRQAVVYTKILSTCLSILI